MKSVFKKGHRTKTKLPSLTFIYYGRPKELTLMGGIWNSYVAKRIWIVNWKNYKSLFVIKFSSVKKKLKQFIAQQSLGNLCGILRAQHPGSINHGPVELDYRKERGLSVPSSWDVLNPDTQWPQAPRNREYCVIRMLSHCQDCILHS